MDKPELFAVRQSLFLLLHVTDGVESVDVVEEGRVGGEAGLALPPRRHHHRRHLRQWAARQLLEPVPARAGEEDDDAGGDGGDADSVPPPPAEVVLDVHQHGHGAEGADADEEEEPVEEAAHLGPLLLVALVELVGAEPRHARLQPACAQRSEVQS